MNENPISSFSRDRCWGHNRTPFFTSLKLSRATTCFSSSGRATNPRDRTIPSKAPYIKILFPPPIVTGATDPLVSIHIGSHFYARGDESARRAFPHAVHTDLTTSQARVLRPHSWIVDRELLLAAKARIAR